MCVDVAWETSLWFGERHGEDLIRLISRKVSLWRMTFYISNLTTTLCFLFTDFSMMSFFSVFLGTLHCKSRFWRKDIYMTRFLCHSSLMQHKDIKPRIRVKAKQKTLHFRGGGLNYYYTQQLAKPRTLRMSQEASPVCGSEWLFLNPKTCILNFTMKETRRRCIGRDFSWTYFRGHISLMILYTFIESIFLV